MNIIQHSAARRVRAAVVTAAVAGASVAGLLGAGAAQASTASHRATGFVVIDSCTSVWGNITYAPGLRSTKVEREVAILNGTTSGCSDVFNGHDRERHVHRHPVRQRQPGRGELQRHVHHQPGPARKGRPGRCALPGQRRKTSLPG